MSNAMYISDRGSKIKKDVMNTDVIKQNSKPMLSSHGETTLLKTKKALLSLEPVSLGRQTISARATRRFAS